MTPRRRSRTTTLLALSLISFTPGCEKRDPDLAAQNEPPSARPAAEGGAPEVIAETDTIAAPGPEPRPDLTGWTVALGKSGVFEVAWQLSGGKMPRNDDFDLDLLLMKNGLPFPGANITVSGWMPDHGHGMVRTPIVTETENGHYMVEGMLLHMRGRWDLSFQIATDAGINTVMYSLEL